MKTFVKKGDLSLLGKGYLVTGEKELPVTNEAFIKAQQQAEYVITFAELAKGKDFVGKHADSLADVKAAVEEKLNFTKVAFITSPTEPTRKLYDQFKEEALSFVSFEKSKNETSKINNFMQQFVVIQEFEDFGLFFEEGIVTLNKIYTVEEVLTAVKACINQLS